MEPGLRARVGLRSSADECADERGLNPPNQLMHACVLAFIMRDTAVVAQESRVMAALTFSGSASEDSVHRKLKELQALLSEKGIAMKDGAAPKYEVARYNPPWTLPFLRTNEVLIPVPESAVPSADAIEETK
mmetsp:Transcript_31121/g.65607  ORF Transcript_31121/g.65607 Transcript_31121/m.65607 type:complete len:132 (+) Transcript_31121:174-569(+)